MLRRLPAFRSCPFAELPPTPAPRTCASASCCRTLQSAIGDALLAGALRALEDAGVARGRRSRSRRCPGALEVPLALQRMAQTGDYDALIALGAVIRGETYHFEIVANESAAGVASVQLEFGIPIGNGILTTDTDEQAQCACRQPRGAMRRWPRSRWPTCSAIDDDEHRERQPPRARANSRCRASISGCWRAPTPPTIRAQLARGGRVREVRCRHSSTGCGRESPRSSTGWSRRSRRISTAQPPQLSPIEKSVLVIGAWELLRAARRSVPGGDQRGGRAGQVLRRHRWPQVRQRRARQAGGRGASRRGRRVARSSVTAFAPAPTHSRGHGGARRVRTDRALLPAPRAHAVLGVGDDAALRRADAGLRARGVGRHARRGAAFLRGRRSRSARPQDARREPLRHGGDGREPRWALLAGALPAIDEAWLAAFARGFFALADAHGVDLDRRRHDARTAQPVRDDPRRGPAGQALRRSGAQPGDAIYVSGALGEAALAVAQHRGTCRARRRRACAMRARAAAADPARRARRAAARRGNRGDRRFRRARRRSRPCARRVGRRRDARSRGDPARPGDRPRSRRAQRELALALPPCRRRRLRAVLHRAASAARATSTRMAAASSGFR